MYDVIVREVRPGWLPGPQNLTTNPAGLLLVDLRIGEKPSLAQDRIHAVQALLRGPAPSKGTPRCGSAPALFGSSRGRGHTGGHRPAPTGCPPYSRFTSSWQLPYGRFSCFCSLGGARSGRCSRVSSGFSSLPAVYPPLTRPGGRLPQFQQTPRP